jgi:cytochrome c oxidase subunit 1
MSDFVHPIERRITITLADEERLRRQLAETWYVPRGILGWFSVTDHKTIGKRYITTAFGFFIFAGILAALMRIQLAVPNNHFVGPDLYNQIFTVHGTMMMFLFAVPVMEALGVYLVPLMIGTRSIAFPRLNAFSYYVYLFGGVMLVVTMLLNTAPDVGWFSYVPLAGPDYAPGKRADFWAQLITFTEVAALAVSVELVATIFKARAPGMSLNRMPLFVWSMLVTAFMVIFAMPSIVTSSSFLLLDRLVGTHFYNPAEGGDALLWQHLFWFFGHPEVYIIFVPALGIVSSIISAFTWRPIFGYPAMVMSLVATGFIGFGLWVHHMFATGLPALGLEYFTAASIVIAIPTGVQIFCWIASLWRGRPRFHTPMLFVAGFFGSLRARRPLGRHARVGAVRSAGPRLLLRRGALSLRSAGRRGVSADRRHLLLVPEDDGPHDGRQPRQDQFLAAVHRLQRDVLSDAHPRVRGDAASRLHLPRQHGMGDVEPDLESWRAAAGARRSAVRLQRRAQLRVGARCRR